MEIVFIGSLFPDGNYEEIIRNSKKNILFANNILQWNFVKGFIKNNCKITVINAPMVGSYPLLYRKIKISKYFQKLKDDSYLISVWYLNIPLIKDLLIYWNLRRAIESSTKKSNISAIVVYGIHTPYIKAIMSLVSKNIETKVVLVVPDLPEYYNQSKNIFSFIKNIFSEDYYKYLGFFNKYVLITKSMKEKLPVNDNFVVIEGMVDMKPNDDREQLRSSRNKIIIYSGTLAKRYGIVDLLQAFIEIDHFEYMLWLFGEGDAKDIIKDYQKKDKRIQYYGIVKKEELIGYEKEGTVLVNPRKNDSEYTKYSFPSKTLEYMLSGIPVLMYKLDGIPLEYYQYISFFEDNSLSEMKNKIIEMCEMDYSLNREIGKQARDFVLEKKNNRVQVSKLLKYINE